MLAEVEKFMNDPGRLVEGAWRGGDGRGVKLGNFRFSRVTARSSADRNREISCRVKRRRAARGGAGQRKSVSRSRVASAMPIESSVNGLPVGPITVAPFFTQRPASGISAVMTMSLGVTRSTIQSSATSGPFRHDDAFDQVGARHVHEELATTKTLRP